MTSEKAGGVNIGLVVLALAGIAFGCYGLFLADHEPPPGVPGVSDADIARDSSGRRTGAHSSGNPDSQTGDSLPNRTRALDAPHEENSGSESPGSCGAGLVTNDGYRAGLPPTDLGAGVIRGKVVDERGVACAGVAITALRANFPQQYIYYNCSESLDEYARRV